MHAVHAGETEQRKTAVAVTRVDALPAPPRPPLERTALFLDVDGTLVEIAPTPESVIVPPDLVPLLQQLHAALDGALAIVSGRTIAMLDRLLGPTGLPAAGVHGGEFRIDPHGAVTEITPRASSRLKICEALMH